MSVRSEAYAWNVIDGERCRREGKLPDPPEDPEMAEAYMSGWTRAGQSFPRMERMSETSIDISEPPADTTADAELDTTGDSRPEQGAHWSSGTAAPWYQGWDLSDEERTRYRELSRDSHARKMLAMSGEGPDPLHAINQPRLSPLTLMPQLAPNGLRALSLFSGGGGMDLGFDRAGFTHVASYDFKEATGPTLKAARPDWAVFAGPAGDVTTVDWSAYEGAVDVIHGGPPCQPFSNSGRQRGAEDARDMVPEFVRAVLEARPRAFLLENVPSLAGSKFEPYLAETLHGPLKADYLITMFKRSTDQYGLPQSRKRVFFVGIRREAEVGPYAPPEVTHDSSHLKPKRGKGRPRQDDLFAGLGATQLPRAPGVREALGLSDIGHDALAPTIRSGLTGPRNSTSILNGSSSQASWAKLEIWPNGVARSRSKAQAFVAKNGHFRLSIQDIAVIQGFPEDWPLHEAVYKALGQIGNAVAPPVAYHVAKSIALAFD